MSIKNILIKDIKIVLSDKKAFILLIGMPIILFSILSFALAGTFSEDGDVWDITIGVVKSYEFDEDYKLINEYVSVEDARDLESILFEVLDSDALDFMSYEILDYDTAVERLDDNELASIVILPKHYVSNLALNMSPTLRLPIDIEIIKSIDKQYSSSIVENIISGISTQMSQMMIANKVAHESLAFYNVPDEIAEAVLEGFQANRDEVALDLTIENYQVDKLKQVNSAQYYSVAMMAMFLLFGASYGAKFMLEEKKKFTLQRQFMSGVSAIKIVAGKLGLIYVIALMQISIMILTSSIAFDVYWGNPLLVVLLTLIVAFAITGFGTVLAAVAMQMASLKALNVLESGIFQVIALFGGSYFPLHMMPSWFQTVSKMLVNGAALDVYHKNMMDMPLEEMSFALGSLLLNGLVFMTIGLVIIKMNQSKESGVTQ